jgi:hypothetical protein
MRSAARFGWAPAALLALACGTPETPEPDAPLMADPAVAVAGDERARLEALGYALSVETAGEEKGVARHDEARAQPGWNLYLTTGGRRATLIDMRGRVLHTWQDPDGPPAGVGAGPSLGLWWRSAHLFANGDLLAQADYGPLVKVAADSRPIWRAHDSYHHDFDVAPDGRILAILGTESIQHPSFPHPLSEDFVVELSPDGVERRRVSLLDAMLKSGEQAAIRDLRRYQKQTDDAAARQDLTHLNALEILGPEAAAVHDAFRPGRLLLSTPKNHRLLLLDFASGEIPWSLTGGFRLQHDPTVTPDGRLLLFDNLGAGEERSRVLEVDPESGEERWSFASSAEEPLFSRCCGRVHPLANGNLLVVVSMEGRALEITREGEVVWEFRSPDQVEGATAILNDVLRIDPSSLDPDFVARLENATR